jgi:hypothetical protein
VDVHTAGTEGDEQRPAGGCHRSSDADDQLELVRTTGAVALLPALTLPAADPALAVRDVAEAKLGRRLLLSF